jgi:nitrogen-specific signal transduction histidine kinase
MYFDKNPQNIYGNRLFENVHPDDIKINIQSNKFLEIDEGEIIYQVGEKSDSFYLLIKGQIKINFYESSSDSTSLSKFDNDFFGEYEILEKIPRKSTAMAAEKSLLYKLSSNELEDVCKIKIIYANLTNPDSSNAGINSQPQDNLEESDELKIDEFEGLGAIAQKSLSSTNSLMQPDDEEGSKDNLSWNSSNIEEYKDIFNDEELLGDGEEKDFSDQVNQAEDIGEIDQAEESEPLFDSARTFSKFKNSNDSIIDRIKGDLKNNNAIQIEKPEKEISNSTENLDTSPNNSEEGMLIDQDVVPTKNNNAEIFSEDARTPEQLNSNQLLTKEHQELTKKIAETIYDEISSPIDLIKKYAHLLMHRSSSIEANSILQKIIDQSNYIINSIRAHTTYLDEKLELNTQILQASTVLDDILHLLAGYAEFRNVKLYRKFEADASIMVDKNLMYQACLQIIKFLCENITKEGSIFVTVNRTKDIIFVEFKSNGNKIPDELLEKIFETFPFKDTAGLRLAKRIISEHNGSIIANNSSDMGPEIKVFLPIVK